MYCYPSIVRQQVVEATFLSVLDYSDVIYSTLKPLDAIYHSSLIYIAGDPFCAHQMLAYHW